MIQLRVAGSAQVNAEEPQVLSTQKEKASYVSGVETARNLRQQGIEVDLDVLIKGLKDEMSGEKLLMTQTEIVATRTALQRGMTREASERHVKPRKVPGGETK